MAADLLIRPPEGWRSAFLAGRLPLDNWIDLSVLLVFLGLGFVLLYQDRWSEGTFVVLGSLIHSSSGLLMSRRRCVQIVERYPVNDLPTDLKNAKSRRFLRPTQSRWPFLIARVPLTGSQV